MFKGKKLHNVTPNGREAWVAEKSNPKKKKRANVITIYTDGGCRNRGDHRGGWGAILIHPEGKEKKLSGGRDDTTSNRMELTAPLRALKSLKRHDLEIHIYSDSQYLIKGMNEWHQGWIRRGWRSSTGEPVKNKELWKKLLKWDKKLNVKWFWVRGHAGDHYQEIAHTLADKGLRKE